METDGRYYLPTLNGIIRSANGLEWENLPGREPPAALKDAPLDLQSVEPFDLLDETWVANGALRDLQAAHACDKH